MNLFFPQWQGSGKIELYQGAHQLLKSAPFSTKSFESIPVALTYSLTSSENILGYSQITAQLSEACRTIANHNPNKIFTLGGDCGVELAPVSFLNPKYGSSLAVIWLDAHGDLNTPDSSPSAHFHGMPLRTLLGEGDPAILKQIFSTLLPEQIFLVGTRELDPLEGHFIQQRSLSFLPAKAVNEANYERLIIQLNRGSFTKLYIHLDLDVIDPTDFPHVACPTPNGIHTNNLHKLILSLKENFEIVGASVLEFCPSQSAQFATSASQSLIGLHHTCLSILTQK